MNEQLPCLGLDSRHAASERKAREGSVGPWSGACLTWYVAITGGGGSYHAPCLEGRILRFGAVL